ncbi:uncharacterized protein MYCFIDRAFT_62548 [Pseudocercospora fijiensis CIRAD86]|uniref:FAD/NAD(P)-binding domain-containing protein n=1 Tax=Pseudocercospora fijiensis (strain CIRAD86) TaxID=383855 RepID=N1Q6A9_PSEFD|nr:uncharacterized protein MYCFIDRAFT_62548 [Pseudocercospora fijiensis CIRAD86]EME87794.1 hypothetical protein MYCFIDRAFT_62548 [Pseudocercospora fijiensis CIRAD86]
MSAIPNLPEHHVNGGANSHGIKAETPWTIHDTPIENQRSIKVIVIGAGFSGIYCGIRIPERIRNCELVIYEKNAGVGGAWWENRYPGAACDVPSHSYQFSFNPSPEWSALYAPSREIREYLRSTAEKYGADRFIKLQHTVTDCTWNQDEGKWHVHVRRPDGSIFEDTCNVLVNARGLLNDKQWPDIDGLKTFRGEIMHSAAWNEKYDFTNKRIGVIGGGSSAIQIVPNLQKLPGVQLSCFLRGRFWISPAFGQTVFDQVGLGNSTHFTPEQIQKFKTDPQAWQDFRILVEADSNAIHASTLKGTNMQIAGQKYFEKIMQERLAAKPQYFDWLKPSFAPGCKRLTPGPGFLEALVQDNVTYVRDKISNIEPTGVVTEDGNSHELDVLVCATGFYASAAPPFEIRGLHGKKLKDHWCSRATNYLSLATDSFPNHFLMLGPNGAIGEGSLTMMIESTGDYIIKAIRKIQKENIKSMSVKVARVRDFLEYCDSYFERTVFMDECKSWYRKDGRGVPGDKVTGLWPGSTLHCLEALRSPRWEDFEYEYEAEDGREGREVNQLGWLGNGWAMNQVGDGGARGGDASEHGNRPSNEVLAFYLLPEFQERDFGVPAFPRPEENEHFRIRPWSY